MLAVKGVEARYGNIQVLKGLDLEVHKGEIVTLIGANGAGKDDSAAGHLRGPPSHPGRGLLRRGEHLSNPFPQNCRQGDLPDSGRAGDICER